MGYSFQQAPNQGTTPLRRIFVCTRVPTSATARQTLRFPDPIGMSYFRPRD